MSQPPPFVPSYDYSRFAPAELPEVGARLSGDMTAVATTTAAIRANMALLQRDDGAQRNATITWESVSPDLQTLIASGNWTPRGTWVTGTTYAALDFVLDTVTNLTYICPAGKGHTAGATFAADLALGRWTVLTTSLSSAAVTSLINTLVPGVAVTGDISSGTVKVGALTTPRLLSEKFRFAISPKDAGAKGDGSTIDTAAFNTWFAEILKANNRVGYIEPGKYIINGTALIWDLSSGPTGSQNGGCIFGAGGHASVIDVTGCSGTPQFSLRSDQQYLARAAFYWDFEGFNIAASAASGVEFGRPLGTGTIDAFNGCSIRNVVIQNSNASGTVSLSMAGWYNSHFDRLTVGANSVGGTTDAMRWHQVSFCRGQIAPGNAKVGVRLGQYCFGNSFHGCDFEVLQTLIATTSDGTSSCNEFSGQFVWGSWTGDWRTSGQDGTTNAIVADSLSGPLIIGAASNIGPNGGQLNITGASAGQVVRVQNNQGTLQAGGLAIYRPKGVPAVVTIDTEAAQTGEIDIYRNGALRWRISRDTATESGGSAGSDLEFFAYQDGGGAKTTMRLIRANEGGAVVGSYNAVALQGSTAGNPVVINATGTDADLGLVVQSAGNGKIDITTGTGAGTVSLISNSVAQVQAKSDGVVVGAASGKVAIGASSSTIGVFGATPSAQVTLTGSRASGAALNNLLTELAAKGWFINGTTA